MICHTLLTVVPPLSKPLFIVVGFFILVVGTLLARMSGSIRSDSGLSAFLDLFTSLLGVCVLVFFLGLLRRQLRAGEFVALSIACGVLSSALFRWRLKRPRK